MGAAALKMYALHLLQSWLLRATLALATVTAAAGGSCFSNVTASPSCAVNTVAMALPDRIDCAIRCSKAGSCLSFSHVNGTCALSDSPHRSASDAVTVFRRRVLEPASPNPGYEQQIGDKRFWVFQQRQTGAVLFNRTWDEYETGFGDANEFWSGLQLFRSKSLASCSRILRIEMTTLDGELHAAEWLNFTLSDASTLYTMNCGAFSNSFGFSGDPMAGHRGRQFSTIDRDNDDKPDISCSQLFGNGGFWFGNCVNMNPNGWYSLVDQSASSGTSKYGYMCTYWIGDCQPLRAIRMLLQI